MVKQSTFQTLMHDMMIASGARQDDVDGIGAGESASDNFENNPKLTKLAEVLVEHFERKKAINESTRAIVFSQWRESVGGIVKMLSSQVTSLIKPAQFIGQASKKSNKGTIGSLNSNLGQDGAGMNQKQQQKVRSTCYHQITWNCQVDFIYLDHSYIILLQ